MILYKIKMRWRVRNFGKSQVEVTGVNFGELVALIQKEQIAVDFRRIGDTVMLFETTRRNLPILFDILTRKCYTYRVVTPNASNLWYKLGLVFGGVCLLLLLFVAMQFCWGVKIVSASTEIEDSILHFLDEKGYNGGAWRNIDCDTVEREILSAVPSVSMVNVSRHGLYLIVNTSQNTPPLTPEVPSDHSEGIFATRAGVVSRVFVANGTALVRAGDAVSVGQMLVAPYVLNAEGEEIHCQVSADVYLYVWESSCVEFDTEGVEYGRTGNSVTAMRTVFGGTILSQHEIKVPYEHYEIEVTSEYLSSILPVKVETTHYYETVAVSVTRDFEAEREGLIFEAKQKLLGSMQESEIIEQKHTINQVDGKYYINYYAKCEYKVG